MNFPLKVGKLFRPMGHGFWRSIGFLIPPEGGGGGGKKGNFLKEGGEVGHTMNIARRWAGAKRKSVMNNPTAVCRISQR